MGRTWPLQENVNGSCVGRVCSTNVREGSVVSRAGFEGGALRREVCRRSLPGQKTATLRRTRGLTRDSPYGTAKHEHTKVRRYRHCTVTPIVRRFACACLK